MSSMILRGSRFSYSTKIVQIFEKNSRGAKFSIKIGSKCSFFEEEKALEKCNEKFMTWNLKYVSIFVASSLKLIELPYGKKKSRNSTLEIQQILQMSFDYSNNW